MSGGAWASITSRQMVRAPAFTFENVRGAATFLKWFKNSGVTAEIRAAIATQPHCSLVRLEPIITDRTVHVHVGIDSEDAAGQNMVTYCGRVIMNVVAERYKPQGVSMGVGSALIEGGFNSGKRGSVGVHLVQGKGHHPLLEGHEPQQQRARQNGQSAYGLARAGERQRDGDGARRWVGCARGQRHGDAVVQRGVGEVRAH